MKQMNQFRLILVTMMLTISAVVMAQKTTVTGVLMDKTLNEGEENGKFSQELKGKGRFDMVFSSVGKEELRLTIELGKETSHDLGTIYMKDSETMLKGVEVVAQKPLVKMDVDKI